MLMFFQTLMAGDSWGDCAVPMIQATPWSIIIFGGSLLTVQLGFANLVLAVIVERARQAHEEERQQNLNEQVKKRRDAEVRLLEMCKAIDIDQDGILTLEELMEAYATNEDFRKTLTLLEIDETDLICLFDLMDADRSGDLTYEELISCIHKSETNDLKRQMMMVKLQVQDIWLRIRDSFLTAQENIINEFKGEAKKPSLFDSRTYLIRKLTAENATSLIRRTRTMQSQLSEALSKKASLHHATTVNEKPTDAGTELSPSAFAIRQLRHQINGELQRTQNWIDFEVQRFISHQWPGMESEIKDKEADKKEGKDVVGNPPGLSPRGRSHSPRDGRVVIKETKGPNLQSWQNAQNQWGVWESEDQMISNPRDPRTNGRVSPRERYITN